MCEAVGIRQPVTFYAWEKGALRPILSHFTRYLDVLELERGRRWQRCWSATAGWITSGTPSIGRRQEIACGTTCSCAI